MQNCREDELLYNVVEKDNNVKLLSDKRCGRCKRHNESAGGQFIKFPTQTTALSQTHLDGSRIKKKLSDRVHYDITGIAPMHRDLFSAYLARCVYGDVLSLRDAQYEYPDTEPYLLGAWQQYKKLQASSRVQKQGYPRNPSEQFPDQVLNLNQIASKGDKLR